MKRFSHAVPGVLFSLLVSGCGLDFSFSPSKNEGVSTAKPDAPNGVKATAGREKVSLSWEAASRADSYSVSRGEKSGGPYVEQAELKTTMYVDGAVTNGKPYYYIIQGVNTAGLSAFSAEVSATPGAAEGTTRPPEVNLNTTLSAFPPALTNQSVATFTFNGSGDIGVDHFECQLDGGQWAACASPRPYTALLEGRHVFAVKAVGEHGVEDNTPATVSWRIDLTPPDTSISSSPSALTNSVTATFSFGSDGGTDRLDCRLDGGIWSSCMSPIQYAGLSAGTHTFDARSEDAAGNLDLTPATIDWVIDLSPPQTVLATGPAAITGTTVASFAFYGTDNFSVDRFECQLDGGDWLTCSSPQTYASLATGAHAFHARAVDGAGNIDAASPAWSWIIDVTPPDTTLTLAPAAITSATSASFTFAGIDNEAVGALECRLDAGAWANCMSPKNYANLSTGTHAFEVRSVDIVLNVDASPATYVWNIDLSAPETLVTAEPPGVTSSTAVTFEFSGVDNTAVGHFECNLDASGWMACASPLNYANLATGSHTFGVRSVDIVGNIDPSPSTYGWIIDRTPPETTLILGPSTFTNATSATLVFSGSDNIAVARFECSWDTGTWEACTSPATQSNLSPGLRMFNVRSFDTMGNVDVSPVLYTWTIDQTLPDTMMIAGPSSVTRTTAPLFSFSGSDDNIIARFECSLDSGFWQTCESPAMFDAATAGAHTLAVRAVDGANNGDDSPAGWSWTLDNTPPNTTISSGPDASTSATNASFVFAGSDNLAVDHVECHLDEDAWATCTSPQDLLGIPAGPHTFYVRALDTAGNTNFLPATYSWTIDVTPPDVTLTGSPYRVTNSTSANFSFLGSDNSLVNHFECSVDASDWAICASPIVYGSLTTGPHSFDVRAIDDAGNIDVTPASWAWTIDTSNPETALAAMGPAAVTSYTAASFTFSGSDDIELAGFECRLDAGAYAICTSPKTFTGLSGVAHTFDVRSIDTAGNADLSPAHWSWMVDLTPPDTSLLSTPLPVTIATDATFTFMGNDNQIVDHFECKIDSGAWLTCANGISYSSLTTNISHKFSVRAVDAAGLMDTSPATWNWLIGTRSGVSIAAGINHTCELSNAGGVRCWGDNLGGQLGDGTSIAKPYPVDVTGLTSGVVSLSSSWTHTCVVTSSGGAKCWGQMDFGALGDGSLTGQQPNPVEPAGLSSGVKSISAGHQFSCAVTSGNGVKCWGSNNYGQVGSAGGSYKLTPTDVSGLTSGVASVSAGKDTACAVTLAGSIKCWGNLGGGSTPQNVTGLTSGVAAVTIGWSHLCALTTGGGVKCWGDNQSGQLGNGTTGFTAGVVDVSGLTSGVSAISAGYLFTCALLVNGSVKCWGQNTGYKLGDGTAVDRPTPVFVSGLSGVTAISAGNYHACAVIPGTGGKCWGANRSGQLGTGVAPIKSQPVDVNGLTTGVSAFSAGQFRTCAVTVGGGLICWGNNYFGGVGDGTLLDRQFPTDVSFSASGFVTVAVGNDHSCGLSAVGGVRCWGRNNTGQLGDGSIVDKKTPVDVLGLSSGVAALSLGAAHSCALTVGGGVKCWGDNSSSKLAQSGGGYRVSPIDITGLTSGIMAISAGQNHTCALNTGGGVICWGASNNGILGPDGSGNGPVAITGLSSGVAAISAGAQHSCAVTTAGAVLCWGDNSYGYLGDGTIYGQGPVGVSGLSSGIATVSVGTSHTCAMTTAGSIKCWGENESSSQLGDGSGQNQLTPVDVIGVPVAIGLKTGDSHTCILTNTGGMKCWGNNSSGQLGDGMAWSEVPSWVVGF